MSMLALKENSKGIKYTATYKTYSAIEKVTVTDSEGNTLYNELNFTA